MLSYLVFDSFLCVSGNPIHERGANRARQFFFDSLAVLLTTLHQDNRNLFIVDKSIKSRVVNILPKGNMTKYHHFRNASSRTVWASCRSTQALSMPTRIFTIGFRRRCKISSRFGRAGSPSRPSCRRLPLLPSRFDLKMS